MIIILSFKVYFYLITFFNYISYDKAKIENLLIRTKRFTVLILILQ